METYLTTNSLGDLERDLSAGRIISGLLQRGKHHDMGFTASLPQTTGKVHSG